MCLKWITWKSLLAFYQSCRLLLQKHTQQHSLSGCQQPSGCTDWLADQLACRPVCEQQLNDCVMPAILNCVGFLCIAERCRSRGKGDALWLPPTCRDWFGCAWKYVWNRTGMLSVHHTTLYDRPAIQAKAVAVLFTCHSNHSQLGR